jgi:hypothetical protein
MKRPQASQASFVEKLVSDPTKPVDATLLTGFLGKSTREKHSRLYLNPELSSYVDIPDDALLHTEDIPKEYSPLGGVHAWVKRGAQLVRGQSSGAGDQASFFEGPLTHDLLAGGVHAAPQAIPNTAANCLNITVACPVTPVCPPTPLCPSAHAGTCPTQPALVCSHPSQLLPCPTHTIVGCPSQAIVCHQPSPLFACNTPFCPRPTPACPVFTVSGAGCASQTLICQHPSAVCPIQTPFCPTQAIFCQQPSVAHACQTMVCPSAIDACPSAPGGCNPGNFPGGFPGGV